MESARLQREKTNTESISDRSQKSLTPFTTSSRSVLTLSNAYAPVIQLSQPFKSAQSSIPAIQTKLTINESGDQYEQEADRVADNVMRMPESTLQVQRKCGCGGSSTSGESCSCASQPVQLSKQAGNTGTSEVRVPGIVHKVLRSPGQPLDSSVRAFMEPRLGHDLSQVRVHIDSQAAESARAVNALAYTVGRDVVFGAGQYVPQTHGGRRLLAHELTHTLQQGQVGLRLQRTGAGGCARLTETVDEQRDALSRAGLMAHLQIQGSFSRLLSSEVPIPRATKDQRGVSCPAPATPAGRVDLWKFGGGISNVEVGEIKSVNGAQFAQPDVDHYRLRLRELSSRITGGTICPGPADRRDQDFDRLWLGGSLAVGRRPSFDPLTSVVPDSPPTRLGPFWGDPLVKNLNCERRAGGAVIYWCTPRNLTDEEQVAERVRLGIPVGESQRRTAPQTGTRAPTMIYIDPDFREAWRQLPRQVPAGRSFFLVAPNALYEAVVGARQLQQTIRLMQVDATRHPIFQFRVIVWGTLAVTMAVGTMAMITAALVAAAPVAAPVVAAGGAAATGGGAAGGGGAVIIPLFAPAAAQEVAKAAAVVIVVGSVMADSSEAHAAPAVQAAMSDPNVIGVLDVTDDPRALAGQGLGNNVTVDDRPYRVVGAFHSF